MHRLDKLHAGITEYFGGRLSLAPLEDTTPERILELGFALKAIQAATQFPAADVLGVDISPIPPRPLPPNLRWQYVDLTQDPFPPELAEGTFDIVHARLVMMHLPHGASILQRAAALVRPGGWLLVEDPDDDRMRDGGGALGPGMARFVGCWRALLRARGAEPALGRALEGLVRGTGLFEGGRAGVWVRRVVVPLSEKSADEAENRLGRAWKANMVRNTRDLPARLAAHGITEEVAAQTLEELLDPERNLTTDMYFLWARRRA
ncbi:hypothetical protein DENSPDRAFT_783920 [Dentipellis sp. KUC8613]|nr:hypothetical protein DENSPDRAFT_783920 [Dentipellis sp. KUC8613]